MDRILRLPDVIAATGLSRVSIWRKEKSGVFPARLRLGPNAVGWRASQIQQWLEDRDLGPLPQPAALSGRGETTSAEEPCST